MQACENKAEVSRLVQEFSSFARYGFQYTHILSFYVIYRTSVDVHHLQSSTFCTSTDLLSVYTETELVFIFFSYATFMSLRV